MHSSIHCIFINFNIMASINNFIFWTKNYLFRPNAIKQYKASLVNIENDSNLKTLNWEKRVSIIRYAYNNIPFYRKYYDDNGFHPNMLKSENDWNLIPILEKKYILFLMTKEKIAFRSVNLTLWDLPIHNSFCRNHS